MGRVHPVGAPQPLGIVGKRHGCLGDADGKSAKTKSREASALLFGGVAQLHAFGPVDALGDRFQFSVEWRFCCVNRLRIRSSRVGRSYDFCCQIEAANGTAGKNLR